MNFKTSCLFTFFCFLTFSNLFAGNALNFNRAQNDRVEIPDSESLDINVSEITLEAWVNLPDPSQESMTILNKENAYELQISEGIFEVAIQTNNDWDWVGRNDDLEADRWYHVAATYDGMTMRVYIDGELTTTSNRRGNVNERDVPLYIGNRPLNDFASGFNGLIDEVRVWNTARSNRELREFSNRYLTGTEEGLVGYWRLDEGEGQTVFDHTSNDNDGTLGARENADNADPAWVMPGAEIIGGILHLNRESVHFPPLIEGSANDQIFTLQNLSIQEGFDISWAFAGAEDLPEWIGIDPQAGLTEPEQESDVTFSVITDDLEAGEYEYSVILANDAVNYESIEIEINVLVVEGTGTLSGQVTDAGVEGDAIVGAIVSMDAAYQLSTMTDEEGNYVFQNLPAHRYTLMVEAIDFLPWYSNEFNLRIDEELEVNPEMLHADFIPQPDRLNIGMQSDDNLAQGMTIVNGGNGPLTWQARKTFPDMEIVDPWVHRLHFSAEEAVDNDRVLSLEFVDNHYFIGAGVRNEDNIIYVVNRDLGVDRQFSQFGTSNYGFRDLTWDGNLMWGCDDNEEGNQMVYGFTLAGDLEVQFESPIDPVYGLAWDRDHDVLWMCGQSTEIVGISNQGEVIFELDRPDPRLHIWGLGYFPDDLDGANLYMFCRDTDEEDGIRRRFYKMNLDTEEIQFVIVPEANGMPLAMTLTGLWDPYNWSIMGLLDGDEIEVDAWQLGPRTDWLALGALEGEVAANSSEEFEVILDSEGLPPDAEFYAELVFDHDGIGGETIVPIDLSIANAEGMEDRTLDLTVGWNLVSVNLTPVGDNFIDVVAPLVESGHLMMAKNGSGRFYIPGIEPGGLENWIGTEGYLLKVTSPVDFRLEGELISWDEEIGLRDGWNMISYLPRENLQAVTAFAGLGENLIIAKDGEGRFFVPVWDFSNIDPMMEGRGYQIKVNGAQAFTYQIVEEANSRDYYYNEEDESWLSELSVTPYSHSLLVNGNGIEKFVSRIEAYTPENVLAGRGVFDPSGRAGIALWGDDPTTEEIDGFVDNETISLRLVNSEGNIEFESLTQEGGQWSVDGWSMVDLSSAELPVEFSLRSAYPNPFNGQLQIEYSLSNSGLVNLSIFDLAGRKVTSIQEGMLNTGYHKVSWNAVGLSSGVYILRLNSGNQTRNMKVLLLK